jgi:TetR/AcrR family transcriptional regulator, repressor for uid operon
MPKLKPDTQRARREHILDAAERSFARAGFHRTTMQDICREAAVSPGALYVYFASKEDLIAGIAERDRATLADQLALVAAAPDLLQALSKLGEHYMVEQPRHKQQLVVELGCESMRGGSVGEIFRACDAAVLDQFEGLFQRAAADGKIRPELDPSTLAHAIAMIGDGLFWRRAVDPKFNAATMVPIVTALIAGLLNPQTSPLEFNLAPSPHIELTP